MNRKGFILCFIGGVIDNLDKGEEFSFYGKVDKLFNIGVWVFFVKYG